MVSFNQITAVGYLGSNPKVHEYKKKDKIVFSLLTEGRFFSKDEDDYKKRKTVWFKVVFRKGKDKTDLILDKLQKGDYVHVQGRFSYIEREGKIIPVIVGTFIADLECPQSALTEEEPPLLLSGNGDTGDPGEIETD